MYLCDASCANRDYIQDLLGAMPKGLCSRYADGSRRYGRQNHRAMGRSDQVRTKGELRGPSSSPHLTMMVVNVMQSAVAKRIGDGAEGGSRTRTAFRPTDFKPVSGLLTSCYCVLPSRIYRRSSRQGKLSIIWSGHVTPSSSPHLSRSSCTKQAIRVVGFHFPSVKIFQACMLTAVFAES